MNQSDTSVAGRDELDYLLRRAEQESIAAIRSADPRAAGPHEHMATRYSAQALELLGERARPIPPG